ncbi:hypothetical protein SRABI27_00861 [Pedobacter sp. Bi27]|nr:hypothetical protein SRABI126_00863 [Pedobacter sp. Bi126]CAH0164785.1 hypothetical protein SRABI27_00861 [Pedobacter sp. Bi27]CAH0283090.1 hypothetical protein SRABI36_04075 [Pedobacter sp. Bi36]
MAIYNLNKNLGALCGFVVKTKNSLIIEAKIKDRIKEL